MRFTKELRQQIIREFAVRHNGQYNPKLFLQEVRNKGEEHPAYEWFEWNSEKAAQEYQLWQAREFARDLKVMFKVENVGRKTPVKVVQAEAPLVISPLNTRRDGGGYVLTNPNDPSHMAEHCRQAANALSAWLRRYGSAVEFAGGSLKSIEQQMKALERASERPADAA